MTVTTFSEFEQVYGASTKEGIIFLFDFMKSFEEEEDIKDDIIIFLNKHSLLDLKDSSIFRLLIISPKTLWMPIA